MAKIGDKVSGRGVMDTELLKELGLARYPTSGQLAWISSKYGGWIHARTCVTIHDVPFYAAFTFESIVRNSLLA